MNYNDTISWMFSQLPMYQNKGKSAYKVDLYNTVKLATHLNNPENKFKSIHVAGTNGKGSTSHMLASILQEAGYKVGLYTSPHLKDYRERIKIDGKCISKHFVIGFIKRNKHFFEENSLSFFEMTVGMAFDYFAKQKVDIAIVEVGLGGRLDSTNIISPEVSVITNIGLDHTQFLGNTLELIASEKAGIIKPKVPAIIGETQRETKDVFKDIAQKNKSKLLFADASIKTTYDSDLKGKYQKHNIKTTIAAINEIKLKGFKIRDSHIKRGFLNVVSNTGLLGRWQILQETPKIICDTAHNREGLAYTMQQVQTENFNELHLVLGFVSDKDLDSIIDLFPENAHYYFCKPNISRGLDASELKEFFKKNNRVGYTYSSVSDAFKNAKSKSKNEDLIYVGGSTFVVAEIL